MAATFSFSEDNGAATGSPAHGTTTTGSRAECNYKAIDDSTTAYTSSPIIAGNNSYVKYQYGYFSGSFNQIGNGLWAHTAGTLGTGLTLVGNVTSTYATPVTTTLTGTSMTTAIAIGSGQTVLFSTVGPQGGSPTSTLTATGYSQYLQSQLQTTTSAAAGDTSSLTLTFEYSEN